MTKELQKLEQRYNALLADIRKMDEDRASGKISPDNCCHLLFYRQACIARDRLLEQIKAKKIAITEHERQHGFPQLHKRQLAFNW